MLCQNCGKNEANVKYTQIINGVKKEIMLCDKCAKGFGIDSFEYNMPIHLSDFIMDFFNDANTDLLPEFVREGHNECTKCGRQYSKFIKTGLLGCPECYDEFSTKIDTILDKLQGSCRHIGRGYKESRSNETIKKEVNNTKKNKVENIKIEKESKTEKLNNDLQKAIKDERYEDAAKIRDELKKLNNEK